MSNRPIPTFLQQSSLAADLQQLLANNGVDNLKVLQKLSKREGGLSKICGGNLGFEMTIEDFIADAEQNKSSSPNNTTSTAVKDTNIGGNLISGVNAQNIDAHTEVHNITNIIHQATIPSSPKKLAVESLPRVNKKSFDLNNKKAIDSGSTSNIYTHESKGQTIAIKIYHPHVICNKMVQREIAALSFLRHQNILPVYGLIVDSDNNIVGYMMEKMSRSLQALLDDKEAISKTSQQQKIIWLIQISSALVYSHDNKIFHADIKPDNILLTESSPAICKVSDFGSAHIIATSTAASASSTSIRGTCGFIAPEWLMGEIKKPTAACDIFSFGVLTWCLFHPGVDKGLGQTENQINVAIINGKRPAISSSTTIPSEIKKLIVECWDHNADIRPTMSAVLAKLERIVGIEKSSTDAAAAKKEVAVVLKKKVLVKEGELYEKFKNFAYGKYTLTEQDLAELALVTDIDDSFLSWCGSLTSIDLEPLSNVTTIGDKFLSHCSALTSIDLAPLSNVTTIEAGFLSACTGLTSINLTPLSNVTDIGDDFLSRCSGLTSINLAPLSNVATIGDQFLYGCSGLTSINLTPLSNVTAIGEAFLYNCSDLASINLDALSNVTTIGDWFLGRCSSLTSISLDALSNVTTIGESFLSGCSSLPSINLHPLSNVATIGDQFLYGCSGLTSINLEPLSNVTTIGDGFLRECVSSPSINLNPLSHVTTIGQYFLSGCSGLTSITLDPLSKLTSVGYGFLYNCSEMVHEEGEKFLKVHGVEVMEEREDPGEEY